jgi:hypothetical protein
MLGFTPLRRSASGIPANVAQLQTRSLTAAKPGPILSLATRHPTDNCDSPTIAKEPILNLFVRLSYHLRWITGIAALLTDALEHYVPVPIKTAWTSELLVALHDVVSTNRGIKIAFAAGFIPSAIAYETLSDYYRNKLVHRAMLDGIDESRDFGGPPATRATVFKIVPGPVAFALFWWRWLRYEDEKWRVIPMCPKPYPLASYLLITSRSSAGVNACSCSMFRVFESNESRSESLLRQIWQSDIKTARNEPTLEGSVHRFLQTPRKHRRSVRTEEWYLELERHAREQNFRSVRHYCAIKRHSPMLTGAVLRNSRGERWGVLVLDSVDGASPFDGRPETELRALIAKYARMIGNTLLGEDV